jgi:glycosyltransferase involved in cell wall biosynthesis
MNQASLLLFPADTVCQSEGFSLSTLEAHMAGAIPAISSVDCLGSIYRDSGCIMEDAPIRNNLKAYTNKVIRALTDETFAAETRQKCFEFAQKYLWPDIAKKMIGVMQTKKPSNITYVESSDQPVISVVMPTMRVGGLDIVLKSLEKQTFKNFEFIISDSIYKYRKDLVSQQSKKYSFTIKHVEPTKNIFPISNFCNSENAGLINASAKLVLLITDYTYLPADCIEKHVNFHTINKEENIGYMCPHQYRSLPKLHSDFSSYKNEDTDLYMYDLFNGKLNNVLWSIFENDFDQDPETLPLDAMGNADNKLVAPYGVGDMFAFNGKNESFKLEAALKINGFDEELDGTTPYQDTVFADMLDKKLGFKWMVDKDNKVYIINPRFVMPWSKRLRPPEANRAIWQRKLQEQYSVVPNNWNIRETRNNILGRPVSEYSIEKLKKLVMGHSK